MDKLKFTLLSIAVLSFLGGLGYWSVSTLQTGAEFRATQNLALKQEEPKDETIDQSQVTAIANSADTTSTELEAVVTPAPEPKQETVVEPKTPEKPAANKNQTLINELQKIIDADVTMKLKSRGTRVGTVQNFLNIYNKTSNKIDNDYGSSTQKAITAFQKDQGLTADGQAGASTFQKMIDWLKKQS